MGRVTEVIDATQKFRGNTRGSRVSCRELTASRRRQEFTAMSITVRKQGDATIIDLDGRLALGGPVDEFRATWSGELAAGNKNLILNLSAVTMVDSSGIGTMIRCHSA